MIRTPFGKFMRGYRAKYDFVMADIAKKLGVNTSFLSLVETGKKNIPLSWKSLIPKKLNLSDEETKKLIESIDDSIDICEVDLSKYDIEQKHLLKSLIKYLSENGKIDDTLKDYCLSL